MKKHTRDLEITTISNRIIATCIIGLSTFGMIMLSILGITF
ncbi:MAG: hypothetical protein E6538_13345 [Paeniclostridium sordellii]|nr:hypothetical protein [Paeniclostridium sordellii]